MHCFLNVSVGFPAGPSAFQTKDNWIAWSTGELRVDETSFALIFSPTGCGRLAAKPFGCLMGATVLPSGEPSVPGAVMATTNDPVHGHVRFTFQSRGDEEAFGRLGQAAEVAIASRQQGGRRSSFTTRPSFGGYAPDEGFAEMVTAQIVSRYPGSCPVVFTGVELYGAEPGGQGSEVLLGRGAVVLLDPLDTNCVGLYELFFFEDNTADPSLRMPIRPRTKLTRQPPDGPSGGSRLSSVVRRHTMVTRGSIAPCALTIFELSDPASQGFGLAFDTEADAVGFERDFAVRKRVVALSLKTSRGLSSLEALEDQILGLKRLGVVATLQWMVFGLIKLAALFILLDCVLLFLSDSNRPLDGIFSSAIQDMMSMTTLVFRKTFDVGGLTCGLFQRGVSAVALERCVVLPESADVRSCASSLLAT